MRRADEQRLAICQYPDPTKPGGIHGIPLEGRGRSKFCPKHSEIRRREKRRAYSAVNTPRWRKANLDLHRLRSYIRYEAQKRSSRLQRPRAVFARLLQKHFGDLAAGQDARFFGHYILQNGFHGYIVAEQQESHLKQVFPETNHNPDALCIHVVAFCDIALPAPSETAEMDHSPPAARFMETLADKWKNCGHCGKPLWWEHPGDVLLWQLLPPLAARRGTHVLHLYPSAPAEHCFPNLPFFRDIPDGNPGLKAWLALAWTRLSSDQKQKLGGKDGLGGMLDKKGAI